MEVYGAGLRRMIEILQEEGEAAQPVLDRFGADKLVASLLLLHGLHPVDAETRIRRALERIERKLGSARVQFLGISEGIAGIRVEGAGNGCGSSASSVAGLIEQAIQEAAPEVEGVRFEGLEAGARIGPLVQISPGAL